MWVDAQSFTWRVCILQPSRWRASRVHHHLRRWRHVRLARMISLEISRSFFVNFQASQWSARTRVHHNLCYWEQEIKILTQNVKFIVVYIVDSKICLSVQIFWVLYHQNYILCLAVLWSSSPKPQSTGWGRADVYHMQVTWPQIWLCNQYKIKIPLYIIIWNATFLIIEIHITQQIITLVQSLWDGDIIQ